jgi:hypothetical protein
MKVGKMKYRCFPATSEEKAILEWFKKLSRLMFGDIGVPNGLYINIGDSSRGQGSHTDWHYLHGAINNDDNYRTLDGSALPTNSEAHTLTLSFMQHTHLPKVPRIAWTRTGTTEEKDIVASVMMMCKAELHGQGPNTQCAMHFIKEVPNPHFGKQANTVNVNDEHGRCLRCTISARIFANPQVCLRCWSKRAIPDFGDIESGKFTHYITGFEDSELTTNPYSSGRNVNGTSLGGLEETKQDGGSNIPKVKVSPEFKRKYNLSHPENSDILSPCGKQTIIDMDIPTSSTFLSERGCVADKYLTAPYIKLFLEKQIIPHVKSPIGIDIPSLAHIVHSDTKQREYFVRGYWYQESEVRDALDMQSGRQNKKERKFQIPNTKDYRHVVGCMNARAYKNILEGINMFFRDPDYRTVEFVGSGGSSEVGGSNGPDSKAALDTNKVVGLLPHNQQLNNINKVLIECTVNDRIVVLFIHSSVCNAIQLMYGTICGQVDFTVPNMIKHMKHMYICLGYFSLDSSYVASGESISSIRERYKDMPKTMAGHFLRFLESKKLSFWGLYWMTNY